MEQKEDWMNLEVFGKDAFKDAQVPIRVGLSKLEKRLGQNLLVRCAKTQFRRRKCLRHSFSGVRTRIQC